MKKLNRWFKNIFTAKEVYQLDLQELLDAMSDSGVRKLWLYDTLEEIKRVNLEIDRRLLTGSPGNITDLAARRKAIQDVMELIRSAKRQIKNHNPKSGEFDLDSVTVGSAYI